MADSQAPGTTAAPSAVDDGASSVKTTTPTPEPEPMLEVKEGDVKPVVGAANGNGVKVEADDVKPPKVEQVDSDLKPAVKVEEGRVTRSANGTGTAKKEEPTYDVIEEYESDAEEQELLLAELSKRRNGKASRKKQEDEAPAQLISHWPLAEKEASREYTEMEDCTYANKTMGNQPYFDFDDDAGHCECTFDGVRGDPQTACGTESQCVNRLMQIECVSGECRCGKFCQNQNFQKKLYASIEIVHAEKKGYGVRAAGGIKADTFIYEYIGEVIGPTIFAKRMKDYADEGIEHFYFMALDKEVFIDATRKGGKGRFLNHSCRPNCFVAKWTVGKKMRMGIFAKRDIALGEELTFNYNVDRYGHAAQACYCGEPNCVGFIGGKTQTDIGGMDDLYIEALGIADEVELWGMKGNKRKKSRKLDEDFNPTLRPILIHECPKVSAAVRQAITNRRILSKLLSRIQMTDDEDVQSMIMRLHGFNLMNHIQQEYPEDDEIIIFDLQILSKWQMKTRNKIESSKIEEAVSKFTGSANAEISSLATTLLQTWSELEMGYRIRREAADLKRAAELEQHEIDRRVRAKYAAEQEASSDTPKKPAFVKPEDFVLDPNRPPPVAPAGWKSYRDSKGRPYFMNEVTKKTQWDYPTKPAEVVAPKKTVSVALEDLLAQAEREAEERAQREKEEAAAAAAEAKRKEEQAAQRKAAKIAAKAAKVEKAKRAKEKAKELKVMKLFSAIVVGVMSKYKSYLEPEQFKRRAKEVTQLLCDKEKKHPSYPTSTYEQLSDEKAAKVKQFTKDWVKKLLERKGIKISSSSSSSSSRHRSTSTSQPPSPSKAAGESSHEGLSGGDADLVAQMVSEVHGDEEIEAEVEEAEEDDDEDHTPKTPPPPPPHTNGAPPPPPETPDQQDLPKLPPELQGGATAMEVDA